MLNVEADHYLPTWAGDEPNRSRVVYALRVDGVVKKLYTSPENFAILTSGEGGRVPDDALSWQVTYVDQISMDFPC